jgi:hypothetical protein
MKIKINMILKTIMIIKIIMIRKILIKINMKLIQKLNHIINLQEKKHFINIKQEKKTSKILSNIKLL